MMKHLISSSRIGHFGDGKPSNIDLLRWFSEDQAISHLVMQARDPYKAMDHLEKGPERRQQQNQVGG